MTPAFRLALIDAAVMDGAIIGALILGMATGPLLSAGHADPAAFAWPICAATIVLIGFAMWRRAGLRRLALPLWTFLGATIAAILLASVASARWPVIGVRSAPNMPRVPLALFTPLDLDQAGRGIEPELAAHFSITRLDTLTGSALADQQRALLVQPRLMTPQELVDFDAWVRKGGMAVILADPLLLWPDGYAPGDRRRAPVTSLLDPLLTHWGLKLEPATGDAIVRRFVGQHLVRTAGASRFRVRPVPEARCDVEADGWMAVCVIGRGHVRLIADADMVDARLWRVGDGDGVASDVVMLVDHWLRAPMTSVPNEATTLWVRDEASLRAGIRVAFTFGTIWAIMGAALLWLWDRAGKAGRRQDLEKKKDFERNKHRTTV